MLRLQPDEKLVALMREGQDRAFDVLFNRYQSRLMAFCRHMVSSPQDAEDVLQEVFVAAHSAILADSRPINARPWLYRIARNRCLNHLRKPTAEGVDSMDVHPHENGTSTLEKVQRREELRAIVSDVHELPETQRTALVLREIDDLSYTDIAQAMGTTLPSVKSLLVRARMSLAECSEARILTCDEVRLELAEAAEGLRKVAGSTRRHVSDCPSCSRYREELRSSTKALAALAPFGLLWLLRKLIPAKLGGSSGAGGTAGTASSVGAGGGGAAGAGGVAGAGSVAAAGSGGMTLGGALTAASTAVTGIGGAIGAKAAIGVATATLITAGAVSVDEVNVAAQRATAPAVSAALGPASALVTDEPVLPVVAEEPPAPPVVEVVPPVEPDPVVEVAPPVDPPPVDPPPVDPPPVDPPPVDPPPVDPPPVDPPPVDPPPVDPPPVDPPPVDPPPVDPPPVDPPPVDPPPVDPPVDPPPVEPPPVDPPPLEPPPVEPPPAG